MKVMKFVSLLAATALTLAAGSAHALVVTASNDANALANAIGGSGITISNATLSSASTEAAGLFSGGANSLGFDKGILLTTGTVNCAPGPNVNSSCTGPGSTTSLKFDFTSTTGNVFFKYVFASEEYNEFVGSQYNDLFQLKLNGVNIALLPGGEGEVSINNVNGGLNSGYYKDNENGLYDIEYDGLTVALTAFATGISGLNQFEFLIKDMGDESYDSGVFIQAGTFSGNNDVPEPASLALVGLGLAGLASRKRKKA